MAPGVDESVYCSDRFESLRRAIPDETGHYWEEMLYI